MIPRPLAVVCLVLVAAGVMAGCQSSVTDVGKRCVLVKRDPTDNDSSDGIRSIAVKESELTEGKDFISFGSTECDDYICVRDQNMPKSGSPQADAVGYCSRPCAVTNTTGCTPSKEAEVDTTGMTCRALLLDENTIATLCNADPAKCRQVFGPNRSPYFCARGDATPDAGQ